jgi:hypothetical protein
MTTYHDSTRSAVPSGVPIGLLTQTGLGTTLVMFIGAVIDLIVGDTFDADTRALLAAGIATAVATILARGYQAGKLYAAQHGVVLPDEPLR